MAPRVPFPLEVREKFDWRKRQLGLGEQWEKLEIFLAQVQNRPFVPFTLHTLGMLQCSFFYHRLPNDEIISIEQFIDKNLVEELVTLNDIAMM